VTKKRKSWIESDQHYHEIQYSRKKSFIVYLVEYEGCDIL